MNESSLSYRTKGLEVAIGRDVRISTLFAVVSLLSLLAVSGLSTYFPSLRLWLQGGIGVLIATFVPVLAVAGHSFENDGYLIGFGILFVQVYLFDLFDIWHARPPGYAYTPMEVFVIHPVTSGVSYAIKFASAAFLAAVVARYALAEAR
jgi:hypothetical protein